ncbi:MAG: hydrogenase maturation protease [Leptolyngbya sp. SIO3F4]|nr:hydrogenase maturation protease [Leptolyngbya sp. SIO3F4]
MAPDYNFLIIGCGNEQFGDAAVGPRVAATVANWNLPTVRSFAVTQLTPELTAELAKTNYVIFVDACSRTRVRTVQIDPVVVCDQQSPSKTFVAHSYAPGALLSLTQRLYRRHPQSWMLQIPIESCDEGSILSSKAYQGCAHALRSIEQFFLTYQQPFEMKSA